MTILAIALGGALGVPARWALGGWIHAWAGTTHDWPGWWSKIEMDPRLGGHDPARGVPSW